MSPLLAAIAKRWQHLSPDRVYLIWHICRKHGINPVADLTIIKRGGDNGHFLQFGQHGLKRHLAANHVAIIHPEIRSESPLQASVGLTLQHGGVTAVVTARVDAVRNRACNLDDLSRHAWSVLLSRLFHPLRIDLDRGEILAEPRVCAGERTVSRAQTMREALTGVDTGGEGAANSASPAPEAQPAGQLRLHRRRRRPDMATATNNLISQMRRCHLIASDDHVPWAIESVLRITFGILEVESWSDSADVRSVAGQILERVCASQGPSPVSATEDQDRLRNYLMKGIRHIQSNARSANPGSPGATPQPAADQPRIPQAA